MHYSHFYTEKIATDTMTRNKIASGKQDLQEGMIHLILLFVLISNSENDVSGVVSGRGRRRPQGAVGE